MPWKEELVKSKQRELQGARVVLCDRILTTKRAKVGTELIQGNLSEKRISWDVKDGVLVIHIADRDRRLESSDRIPIQMSDMLRRFCGIEDGQDSCYLTYILGESSPSRIKAELEPYLRERGLRFRNYRKLPGR